MMIKLPGLGNKFVKTKETIRVEQYPGKFTASSNSPQEEQAMEGKMKELVINLGLNDKQQCDGLPS